MYLFRRRRGGTRELILPSLKMFYPRKPCQKRRAVDGARRRRGQAGKEGRGRQEGGEIVTTTLLQHYPHYVRPQLTLRATDIVTRIEKSLEMGLEEYNI